MSAFKTFHHKDAENDYYRQTDIGLIPKDWQSPELGSVIRFIGGSQPDKSYFRPSAKAGYVRLIQIRDYKSDRHATYVPVKLARRFCNARDIMIGRYGPPIFQILRGIDGAYNVALIKAVPSECIDRDYAYYYLCQESLFAFVEKLSQRSSGQTGVDLVQLKLYPFAAPPTLAEQEAIASALSDADALIESLEQLLAKKRLIKQGAMQELLTGKRRLEGFTDEWRSVRLGSIGTFLKGSGVRKDEANSGDLPCIRYGEIYTKHTDFVREFYSFVSNAVAKTAIALNKGDLLFAGSGETKAEIGKCVAFCAHEIQAYAGGDIVILRPHSEDSSFLGYYLNTKPIAKQKASKGQGDAVVHISAAALASIECCIPSVDEQLAIAETLSDMDSDITEIVGRLRKARQLKQAMMQQLLTGRIRLAREHPAVNSDAANDLQK